MVVEVNKGSRDMRHYKQAWPISGVKKDFDGLCYREKMTMNGYTDSLGFQLLINIADEIAQQQRDQRYEMNTKAYKNTRIFTRMEPTCVSQNKNCRKI